MKSSWRRFGVVNWLLVGDDVVSASLNRVLERVGIGKLDHARRGRG